MTRARDELMRRYNALAEQAANATGSRAIRIVTEMLALKRSLPNPEYKDQHSDE